MSINLDDIAILNINSIDFHSNINGVSKSEAANSFKKCWSKWKQEIIQNNFCLYYKKMDKQNKFREAEIEKLSPT